MLRKKIAELNRTIEDHCQSLTRQQWDEVCNSVDGPMRVGGKWNLLKHPLNDSNSKSHQSQVISRVLHEARQSETEDAILDALTNKYLPIVEGINYTLYADITIWCVGGSEGEVETAPREALDQTEHFLTNTGFKCSSIKSELLLYRPVRRGPKRKGWMPLSEVDITTRTNTGNPIPRVDVLRELGMLIERGGLKDDNLLRLFHAFLMSHITYVAAMHCWHGHEKKKLDTLIRKSIKRLGVHNTLEEIIEAQETAQAARLSSSPAGRKILAVLGLNPTLVAERARAVALLRHVRDEPRSACFVDAAQYGRSARFAAVAIDHKGSILNSAPFKDSTASRAQQAAIALALLDDSRSHIYTDSRSALDSLTNLNDTANSRARALTLRAGKDADLQGGYGEFKDILFTFNEITKHYQMGRRTFSPPHGKLSSNYDHILWRCPSLRGPNKVTEEEWSSAITSSELLPQLRAVQRAHDAAVRLGLPVPTWERPAVLL
ncbi:hypothetical protein HPB47_004699 [Ixodes persulcatus]|uniref:Uncharacterized protein n=1 Tax=Ixodes persulcatus TaxID=34615 RepID=A0AC60PF77_IXOPE|nr:hypothetical protein HPB47_004699 [Ixodes persulcatus]